MRPLASTYRAAALGGFFCVPVMDPLRGSIPRLLLFVGIALGRRPGGALHGA
jgi:hypothetical protein